MLKKIGITVGYYYIWYRYTYIFHYFTAVLISSYRERAVNVHFFWKIKVNCITYRNNIEKLFVKCQNNNKEKYQWFCFSSVQKSQTKTKSWEENLTYINFGNLSKLWISISKREKTVQIYNIYLDIIEFNQYVMLI